MSTASENVDKTKIIGTSILTSHGFSRIDPDIGRCFAPLSNRKVCSLKPGDLFWMDDDAPDPRGRAHAYRLVRVGSVTPKGDGMVWVSHSGGGFLQPRYGKCSGGQKAYRIKRPAQLRKLLASCPRATEPAC